MRCRGERGAIAVLLLLLLLVLVAMATALVHAVAASQQGAGREQASAQALCLAESGIQVAVHRLASGEAYHGDSDVPLGDGRYSVRVVRSRPLEIVASGEAPYGGCLRLRRSIRVRGSLASGRFALGEWSELPATNLPGVGK